MRIITGDECGILKESIPEASRSVNPTERGAVQASANCEGVTRLDTYDSTSSNAVDQFQQTRRNGIVGLASLPASVVETSYDTDDEHHDDDGGGEENEEEEDEGGKVTFAALRANGKVETWVGCRPVVKRGKPTEPGMYRISATTPGGVFAPTNDRAEDDQQQVPSRPIGICCSGNNGIESAMTACVDTMGRLSLLDLSKSPDKSIVARYNAFSSNKTISYTRGNFANNDVATALAMDCNASRIAIGGRERETTLLDVDSGTVLWKAKNIKPDLQTLLQHPIWTTALDFVSSGNGGSGVEIGGSNNLLAVGTAYKQFRIYDVRVSSGTAQQRRPILCTKEGVLSHRVTALCQLDGYGYVVGDAAGDMQTLDLRNLDKGTVGRFAGPGGSIRRIQRHPTLPVLACVSLDRMLRTFDARNRKMLNCIYLKQRLSSMIFCDDETWSLDALEGDDVAMMNGEEGDINEADEIQDYINSDDESGDDDDDAVADMRGGGVFEGSEEDSGEDNATTSSEENDGLDDESSEEENVFSAAPNSKASKRGGGGALSRKKKKRL